MKKDGEQVIVAIAIKTTIIYNIVYYNSSNLI